MKRDFCLFIASLFLQTLVSAGIVVTYGERNAEPVITVNNGVLEIEILPGSNGRITRLYAVSEGVELLPPFVEERTNISPLLPTWWQNNDAGFKDRFWGKVVPARDAYACEVIEDAVAVRIRLEGRYAECLLVREITLAEGSPLLRQVTTLRNESTQAMVIDYWGNWLLSADAFIDPVTVQGQLSVVTNGAESRLIRGRNTQAFTSHGINHFTLGLGQAFLDSSEGWIVRNAVGNAPSFLLSLGGGIAPEQVLFYLWQGRNGVTMEFVREPVSLESGQSVSFAHDVAILPAMDRVIAVLQDSLVLYERGGQVFAFTLSDLKPSEIKFEYSEGEVLLFQLPEASRGKVVSGFNPDLRIGAGVVSSTDSPQLRSAFSRMGPEEI